MSRYIDANDLVRAMTLQANRTVLGEIAPPQLSYSNMLELVADAPTADVVEVRHGEWGFDGLGWTCSECGEYALANQSRVQVHSTYCPHCGARMDA